MPRCLVALFVLLASCAVDSAHHTGDGVLVLPIVVLHAGSDEQVDRIVAATETHLSIANLSVSVERATPLDAHLLDLDEREALVSLERPHRTPDTLLVVLPECARRNGQTAYGWTPRIPLGSERDDEVAGIYVPLAVCTSFDEEPIEVEAIGTLLAHEIGHALGLYHSASSRNDPFDTEVDDFDDTTAENLMFVSPLEPFASGFSPMQISVLRSHPILR